MAIAPPRDRPRTTLTFPQRGIRIRPMLDLAQHQEQEQHGKHGVHPQEAQEAEPAVACRHHLGVAVHGAQQAVNQPGLAAKFGRHPAGGVGDVGQRETAAAGSRASSARCRAGSRHSRNAAIDGHRDEDRPQPDHDVVGVIEQRNVVGPVLLGHVSSGLAPRRPSCARSGSSASWERRLGCRSSVSATLGWPRITSGAPGCVSHRASIAARVTGWLRATMRPCASPVGKSCKHADDQRQQSRRRARRCGPARHVSG